MSPSTTFKIGRRSIVISDPDTVVYPALRFTREAVVAFYVGVARFILPHLENRPVALKRYPNGIHGDSYWEKDAPAFTPSWVKTVAVQRRDTSASPIHYIVIGDKATLAWAASVVALEIHPFLHRASALDTPATVVFDLDPGEGSDVLTCARRFASEGRAGPARAAGVRQGLGIEGVANPCSAQHTGHLRGHPALRAERGRAPGTGPSEARRC